MAFPLVPSRSSRERVKSIFGAHLSGHDRDGKHTRRETTGYWQEPGPPVAAMNRTCRPEANPKSPFHRKARDLDHWPILDRRSRRGEGGGGDCASEDTA